MLASIGKLNAELLSAHYSDTTPSYKHVSDLLKQASVLHKAAQGRVTAAVRSGEDGAQESRRAITAHHVARHTMTPDTMCAQLQCVHVTHQDLPRIQQVVDQLHGSDRVHAIKQLVELVMHTQFSTDVHNPRLCEHTGVACVVATPPVFPESVAGRDELRAREVLAEATHTKTFARVVGLSVVRELEAETYRRNTRLGNKKKKKETGERTVQAFFITHGLGTPPDTDNIRVAINHVVNATVAPRARKAISIDLWSKWVGI